MRKSWPFPTQTKVAAMLIENLNDLFVHTLKDMHYAEAKVLKSLPKMIKAAEDAELKSALEQHMAETEGQIERLKQVFMLIDEKAGSEACDAINGILEEADGVLDDTKGSVVRDDAIIASAQAVEHYEIVRYRSLVMWAGALKHDEAVPLLQQSLDEERRADETLLKFAAYCQTSASEDEADDEEGASGNTSAKITDRKVA